MLRAIIFSLFSAVALSFTFPKFNVAFLAYIAFIPLFISLKEQKRIVCFRLAFLCGVVFFATTHYWLVFVHAGIAAFGFPALVLYCSLYFGLFGLAYYYAENRPILFKVLFLPSVWVCLEWIRSQFLGGFGFTLLGHSQYENIGLISIADTTGVYGVSFLVMMANVYFYEASSIMLIRRYGKSRDLFITTMSIVMIIVPIFTVRFVLDKNELKRKSQLSPEKKIRIALVQANIEQDKKWDKEFSSVIIKKYVTLSRDSLKKVPDVIIWPEASFPGIIGKEDNIYKKFMDSIVHLRKPLIVGSVVKEEKSYYNSALFYNKSGKLEKRYNKRHLVPFGEYVPFRKYLPFADSLPIADFNAGDEWELFDVNGVMLGTFICFEDTNERIARAITRAGADVLVNLTNDAWFEDTRMPYIHLATSVFRAIENRRPLVRATNTGVSAYISSQGRVQQIFKDEFGRATFSEGFAIDKFTIPAYKVTTFYTRFGDVFVGMCAIFCIFGFLKRYKN